jgi:hypothetical protein
MTAAVEEPTIVASVNENDATAAAYVVADKANSNGSTQVNSIANTVTAETGRITRRVPMSRPTGTNHHDATTRRDAANAAPGASSLDPATAERVPTTKNAVNV